MSKHPRRRRKKKKRAVPVAVATETSANAPPFTASLDHATVTTPALATIRSRLTLINQRRAPNG